MDRILRGASAELRVTLYSNGVATDATGTPTVRVERGDGTELVPSTPASKIEGETGVYGLALGLESTLELDSLTSTWDAVLDGANQAFVTHAEIVGGFLISVDDLRSTDGLDEESVDDLMAARTIAETALEDACRVAFVPRYRRVKLDGGGATDLLLPTPELRAVRSASVDGAALSADELADLVVYEEGVVYRSAGWPAGRRNIVLEVEHGYTFPPGRVDLAMKALVKHVLLDSPLSDRATSLTSHDGTTQVVVQAGVRGAVFSYPEANAVVQTYGGYGGVS